MKKLISMIITGAMLLTAFPTVSAAVQTNPGYTTEQPAVKTDAVSLPPLDVGDESAFKGYTLSNVSAGERENADSLADKTGSASVGAGISFSVKGDTLTIIGSGSMQGLMDNSEYPWSDKASGVKHIVIQNGITDIYSYAFMNFKSLESISVPSSVTSIGEAAFYNCTSLKEIVLPYSVKSIGSGAFYYCYSLQKIQISGVTEIGDYAFQNAGVESLTLGKNLKQVSGMAFFGTRLKSIEVDSANTALKAADGVLYNKAMDTLMFYPPHKEGTAFKVPAKVKTIGSCAFCKNLYLTSVDLSAVETLKDSAFQECSSLVSIVIPDSVTKTEDFAFYECKALKSVTFGKGLEATAYQMFRGCEDLAQIDFGGLQSIYAQTFADCISLTSLSLPASVKEIGVGAFGNCKALQSVYAPEVTEIPYQAFLNTIRLTSVDFPKLKNIYRAAFLGTVNLNEVKLPKTTEFVHSIAFEKKVKLVCANPELKPYGYNGLCKQQQVTISGDENYSEAFEVLALVNKERGKNGLKPLVMNQSLMDTAMQRAAECAVLFSHTRPNSSTCMTANSLMIGENIAVNQENADDVMDSWMNSTGHRANILSGDFTTIGVGCFKNNGIITWVQCFGTGSDSASCKKPQNRHATHNIDLATSEFTEANDLDSGRIFGEPETYSFDFSVELDGVYDDMEPGKTAQAHMYVSGSKYSYFKAVLDNTGITWSVKSPDIASVTSGGMVTAKAPGNTEIEAKLKYYSAANTISVNQKTPVIQKIENTGSGISLQWNNCYGADGYIVYYRPESEKMWDYDYTHDTSYTLNHLKPGVRYCFQVCAYSYYGNTNYYSNVVSKTYEISPSLSLSNNSAGLTAAWSSTGADSYVVYYRPAERSTWSSFTATGNKAVIPNTESGKLYFVQVQNIFNGKNGAYSKVKNMTYLARANMTTLTYNDSNALQWSAVDGANQYQIARKKTGDQAYTYYTTTETGFAEQNVTAGTTYTYQVRAMYKTEKNGTAYGEWSSSKSVVTIEKPELRLSNEKNGVRLEWNAAKGAVKYVVYYKKAGDKSWSSTTTANTYYPYLNVTEGQQYYFQLRAIGQNLNGPYSNVVSKTYEISPSLSLSNNSAGLTAAWSSTGADSYVVYYRPAERSTWSSFTATGNKAVIPNTESGKLYFVQVQNIFNGKNGAYSKVKSMTYLARANMTTLTYNGSNALQWSAVDGANKYQIAKIRKGDKAYTYYTTTSTSFTDKNVTTANAYYYQVRAMYATEKNGTAYGAWSSTKSVVTLAQATVSLANKSNGIRAAWGAVKGAQRYAVYYKAAEDSKWTVASTYNTYYPILGVKSGTLYFVQVRPVAGNVSGTYSKVKGMTFIGVPDVTLSNTVDSAVVSWKKVDGANGYQIAKLKKGASAFSYINTEETSYSDKDVAGGSVYYYQVRAMYKTEKNGTAYGEWSSSKSVVTIEKPELRLSNEKNGVRL